MIDFAARQCKPLKNDSSLEIEAATSYKQHIHQDWQLDDNTKSIQRQFKFKNFHDTMTFVNAVAWIAHQQDHHPDLNVGYNRCTVHYSTHSAGGLSENDFICAARIDALFV